MFRPLFGRTGPRSTPPACASAAGRLRQSRKEEALREITLTTLAQAYLAKEVVFLDRGGSWRWERDGIPDWLVPRFKGLGLLP